MKVNWIFCVLGVVFAASLANGKNSEPRQLSPVIFVPGDGGSQVEAKLDKPTIVHYICQKKTDDWFNIWLNMELLVPVVIDCWIDNVRLYYNSTTRKTYNSPGVEIRIPKFGDPEVVEWIDPSHATSGSYFKAISQALVDNIGYVRMTSIRGAPYDFRKAPDENQQWFADMKDLIEDTYRLNDNSSVTLITHSMGSPMTLVLLQQLSYEWKTKHIRRVISLAGAWAGSVKAVKVFAMGDDLGAFALNGKVLRAEQITSPSLAWLLPSPLFWKSNEVLVEAADRQYKMHELEQFLNDLDYQTGWEMRKDSIKYTLNFSPPDVELHCIYGSNIPTVEKLRYKKSVMVGEKPTLINGDGDGTVNSRSLQACMHWKKLQYPEIKTMAVPNVDHMAILNNARVIKYIVDLLSSK